MIYAPQQLIGLALVLAATVALLVVLGARRAEDPESRDLEAQSESGEYEEHRVAVTLAERVEELERQVQLLERRLREVETWRVGR